jgi:hypothetical protein
VLSHGVRYTVVAALALGLTGQRPSPPAIDVNNDVFLASAASQGCVTSYSSFSLGQRGFAFDGTVTSIDDEDGGIFATVTFRVHRWFRYGARDHVVASMLPAGYRVGDRMLVSAGPTVAW